MVFSTKGSRAVVTVGIYDSSNEFWSSRVAVIDTATGKQVGTTLEVPHAGVGFAMISADGSRAVVVAADSSGGSAAPVMVLDTATGLQVGDTVTVDGALRTAVLSPNGSRVVVGTHSHVAVIDTVSGEQVGQTLTGGDFTTLVSADGSRAVVTADQYDYVGGASSVTVIDTATGQQVGSTVTLPRDGSEVSTVLSADGSHAVATVYATDARRVAVIDTATGQQVGSTLSVPGAQTLDYAVGPDLVLSRDGSRALIRSVSPLQSIFAGVVQLVSFGIFIPPLWPIVLPVVWGAQLYASLFSIEQWQVIDTVAGTRAGTLTISGLNGNTAPRPVLSADGSRAVVLGATGWRLSNLGRDSTLIAVLPIA